MNSHYDYRFGIDGDKERIAEMLWKAFGILSRGPRYGLRMRVAEVIELRATREQPASLKVKLQGGGKPKTFLLCTVLAPSAPLTDHYKMVLMRQNVRAIILHVRSRFRTVVRTLACLLRRCIEDPEGYFGFRPPAFVTSRRDQLTRGERRHPRVAMREKALQNRTPLAFAA